MTLFLMKWKMPKTERRTRLHLINISGLTVDRNGGSWAMALAQIEDKEIDIFVASESELGYETVLSKQTAAQHMQEAISLSCACRRILPDCDTKESQSRWHVIIGSRYDSTQGYRERHG